jgi:hypothetical protein
MVSGREESRGVGSPHYYVGVVQRVPWPNDLDDAVRAELRTFGEKLVEFRRASDAFDETTRSFIAPTIARLRQNSIEQSVIDSFAADTPRVVEAIDTAHKIDLLLVDALGIADDSAEFLDEEAPASAAAFPAVELDENQRVDLARLASMTMSDLVKVAVERCGGSRSVVAKSYVADRRIELIAQILRRHPSVVLSALVDSKYMPPGEPAKSATALFSYLVGCAFGRWDVRAVGTHQEMTGPFDPVSPCAPGALVSADGYPAPAAPDHYALKLPPNRLLLDEPGHQWDLLTGVDAVVEQLFEDGDSVTTELVQILRRASLRDYLRRDFFKNHLAQYTESRRKAPIYWPLSVPSGKWTAWVYAPTLSRETLYAVASEALRRENLATSEVGRLEQERASGGGGRGRRELDQALDAERALGEELRRFRQEAERIANLGWEPDLDDGIVLCAAPLGDLFPQWNEPAQYREQLRTGQYEWATVSRWSAVL